MNVIIHIKNQSLFPPDPAKRICMPVCGMCNWAANKDCLRKKKNPFRVNRNPSTGLTLLFNLLRTSVSEDDSRIETPGH